MDLDLPDVNVLVALLAPAHVHHATAQEWWSLGTRVATTPLTETGFVRVAGNPVVTGPSASPRAALASLHALRSHPRTDFLPDDTSLADPTVDVRNLVGFRQVTDLHLVGVAARHGARLVTLDARIAPTLAPSDAQHVVTLT